MRRAVQALATATRSITSPYLVYGGSPAVVNIALLVAGAGIEPPSLHTLKEFPFTDEGVFDF